MLRFPARQYYGSDGQPHLSSPARRTRANAREGRSVLLEWCRPRRIHASVPEDGFVCRPQSLARCHGYPGADQSHQSGQRLSDSGTSSVKRFQRIAGYLVAAALVGYFLWFASSNLDIRVLHELLTPPVIGTLIVAALAYAAIIPVTGWAWARLLAAQGESWPVSWLTAVLAVTQLAKYLPGNIAQHAGRAGLAMREGMAGKSVAITVLQETVLAVAASLIVGVSMLAASEPGLAQLPDGVRPVLAWVVPILLLSVLFLSTVHLSPARLATSPTRAMRLLGKAGGLPGARIALPALAAYAFNYLLIGSGLWLLARSAELPAALDLPLITAAFALSWLLGFLAPGAPAGLGVREGILIVLLAGVGSDGELLAFVLLARATTMLGDVINFLLGSLWLSLTRRIAR
ncbi:hypothetical protein B1808_13230 [Pseudofulvimonas gallinarii]|nr:hypothetical protein B1808_13230 [Pseudofulvimonas gallinarii]